jgi:5-methylcytosine-specific restriction endonuclease McrA
MSEISEATRRYVRERAGNRCEYCLSHQNYVLGQLQIDHISPSSKAAQTTRIIFASPVNCAISINGQNRMVGIPTRDKRLLSFIRDGNDGPIILRGGQRGWKSPASPLAAARR